MYLLIIFLPFLGFLVASLFSNFLSKKGSIVIIITLMAFTASLSFYIFYEIVLCKSVCSLKLFP